MRFLIYAVITVMLLLASAIINGYTLSVLWGWFIVPTFELPQIGVAAAVGLSLTLTYVTHHVRMDQRTPKTPYDELLAEATLLMLLKPMLILSLGYACKLFM